MALNVKVIGSGGKMGKRVVSLISEDSLFSLEESTEKADVIIDFSSHLALKENLMQALALNKPIVIGTTGHSLENLEEMERASQHIPVLFAPNFSLAMAACIEAASLLSKLLKTACSIEIVEKHHLSKKDSPSGTALALKNAMDCENPVPIYSLREGDVIGEHKITFTCEGEKIEISHQAATRNVFAQGALKAGHFLTEQPPGLYNIKDLFHVYSR